MGKFGVHSEVGTLRTVMVCTPGLAHQRLTPGNCHDLLFDDVVWVHEARKDHYDFVLKMRERDIEVLELHDMLEQTLAVPEARAFVLDRRITPPIPNTLFQRDPSCWIYDGVTVNPMYWPARQPETLILRAIYKFHPMFRGQATIWCGDSDESFANSSVGGGDVMPIGKGNVLIGMGERTTRQAVFQVAEALLKNKAATRVIACAMPKSRAAMHLDTVFSFLDRDAVTLFREVVDQIRCYSIRAGDSEGSVDVRPDEGTLLDVVKEALGIKALRIVETGGNLRGRARTVGRRQQRGGAGARRGRRL